MRGEKGFSLLETILALALLGIISACFLGATATTSSARVTADEKASGKILAESMMESIKKNTYAPSYDDVTVPAAFAGYSANITIEENNNIQDITISIIRRNHEVFALESYKVNRD
jgi:prepilin-type N-terminal cleavage/methylation domain-containing protein